MITFEQAKIIAKKLDPELNSCTEYEDAFVFSHADSTLIGDEPIVILKNSGKAIWMPSYMGMPGIAKYVKYRGRF